MENFQTFLDPQLLALLAIGVAISYLVGVITGEHPAKRSAYGDTGRRRVEGRRAGE